MPADGATCKIPSSGPAVLLLGRDLRVDDNPALAAACAAGRRAVPLFVYDDRLLAATTTGPNRIGFLAEALEDLRRSLRRRGGELYVRRGDPAALALSAARASGASEVHVTADVTAYARRRVEDLQRRCAAAGIRLVVHPGGTVVDPQALRPAGGDHYKVFTPYFRAWSAAPRRPLAAAPETVLAAESAEPGELLGPAALAAGADPVGRREHARFDLGPESPERVRGGEGEAWRRLGGWEQLGGPCGYTSASDDLAAGATSNVAAYLHFGCLSAARLESWALGQSGAQGERPAGRGSAAEDVGAFVRQLCWRDFFHAVTQAFPEIARRDYRPRPISWRRDDAELEAWKQGRTGVELVDAAMLQLRREGFVHNRARLVAASYLTKTLRHHWREGADHYLYWLTDGDVANNSGNWQWMAGTGNDTRPNRVLNPYRQAARFDADGAYRDRYLAGRRAGQPGELDEPASP